MIRNKSVNQDLMPSDPLFDRSLLSSDDYIERLLFENRELQSLLKSKQGKIEDLEEQLNRYNQPSTDHNTSPVKSSTPTQPAINTHDKIGVASHNTITPRKPDLPDIPLRSARRSPNVRLEMTSPPPNANGSSKVASEDSDHVLGASKPDSAEFDDHTKAALEDALRSNRSSVYSDELSKTSPLQPKRSTQAKSQFSKEQNAPNQRPDDSLLNSTFSEFSSYNEIIDTTPREVSESKVHLHNSAEINAESPGLNAPDDDRTSAHDTTIDSNNKNFDSTSDRISDRNSDRPSDRTSNRISESQSDNAEVSDQEKVRGKHNGLSQSVPYTPVDSEEDKSLNPLAASLGQDAIRKKKSGSFSSYKSRIRLPPSMHAHQSKHPDFEKNTNRRNENMSVFHSNNSQNSIHSSITSPRLAVDQNTSSSFTDKSIRSNKLDPTASSPSTQHFPATVNDSSKHTANVASEYDYNKEAETSFNNFSIESFTQTSSPYLKNNNSSFLVLSSQRPVDDDSTLVVKPEEFHTITMVVVSTIHFGGGTLSSKDPNCSISILDRKTKKEMWRVRKTYSQLQALHNEIAPYIENFGLPAIPDKLLFASSSPVKTDTRRIALQGYFNSITLMPHIPHMVLTRICRYLSLNIVNPLNDFQSGSKKEGFLIRRYKGLGSSWKIRWCQLEGSSLQIFDCPGGQSLETIKLAGTQIGKQTQDSVAEERGYRHAFLVMDLQKSKLATSPQKYFFCAETDEERDEWVNALVETNESEVESPTLATSLSANLSNNYSNNYSELPAPQTYTHLQPKQSRQTSKSINPQESHNQLLLPSEEEEGLGLRRQTTTELASFNSSAIDLDQKEIKKLRKRSIFPFKRSANESAYDTISNTPTSNPQHVSNQSPTQVRNYLNQLSLDNNLTRAVFGRDLGSAIELSSGKIYGRPVPSVCYRCIDYLTRTGAIHEVGIFRLSGSTAVIRQLKEQFNTKFDLDLLESELKPDIHTVTGLLKTYLRELPVPIVGPALNELNNIAINGAKLLSPSDMARRFKECFKDRTLVDQIHFDMCYVIFKFLTTIISKSKINRMNLRNVCIVFVPTFNISLEVLHVLLVDFLCIFDNGEAIPDSQYEVLDFHIPTF